jgi:hypothetical protein
MPTRSREFHSHLRGAKFLVGDTGGGRFSKTLEAGQSYFGFFEGRPVPTWRPVAILRRRLGVERDASPLDTGLVGSRLGRGVGHLDPAGVVAGAAAAEDGSEDD